MEGDYAIIGGGIVGLSIAWGLQALGKSVIVLDGEDGSFRASRGNYGLVWIQSKGLKQPRYARWSQTSAGLWRGFADELTDNTGSNVGLEQNGGLDLHFSEETLAAKAQSYAGLRDKLGGRFEDYPYEIVGANALRKEEPEIGPSVVGAILHHQDGHANPLNLLKALADDVRRRAGRVLNGKRVTTITAKGGFVTSCSDGTQVRSAKLVLAAGLGAAVLGPQLGFTAPVSPERGQILITEKMPKMINRPSLIARQTDEGGIQIGATNEKTGMNDGVTADAISKLAQEAIAAYPRLANAQLVRSWGALRVLTPDGLPIYQESSLHPGAFLVTCHSGVTLAAAHARLLPHWLEKTDGAPELEVFNEARF